MTGPRTDQDVDRALSEWMHDVAPTRPPVRLLEETFVETMRGKQDVVRPWNRIDLGRATRRGWEPGQVLVLVIVVVLLAAAMVVALSAGARPSVAPPSPGPSVLAVAASASPTPSLPPAIPVAPDAVIDVDQPIAMAAGGAFLWILGPGRVDKVDPTGNAIGGSVVIGPTSDAYQGLAATGTDVWATNVTPQQLVRVDSAKLTVAARIAAGLAPKGVLATSKAVWVADLHGGTVLRIDPADNKYVARSDVGPTGASGPNWLGSGLGSIWADIPNDGTVVRIDPVTDAIQATITLPPTALACGGFGIGTDAVWVTACAGGTQVTRIDPATNLVVGTTELGGNGYNPAMINGAPWISVDPGTAEAGYLARIDPSTNLVDRVLVPGTPFGGGGDIVVAAGSVWVTDGYHSKLLRLPMSAFAP